MIKELVVDFFYGKTDNTFFQLFRYTLVGGVSFMADFTTLIFLTEFHGVNYLFSAGVGFLVGLIINYILSIVWVFSESSYENKMIEFIFFLSIGLIGLGLNELLIWILTEKVKTHYLVSKITTTALIYFWNFFVRKYLVFKKRI